MLVTEHSKLSTGRADAARHAQLEVICLSHSPKMTLDPADGTEFREAGTRMAASVAAYDPTLVIYFGTDHQRALTDLVPCFTVAERATGYGDWKTPTDAYNVPTELARALTRHLLAHDMEPASAHHLRLDHGFALSMLQIFGSVSSVPTIPILINCIGLPMASMRRIARLGHEVRRFIEAHVSPSERVLVMASGGLSHAPPNLVPGHADLPREQQAELLLKARDLVNPAWDEQFLNRLETGDWAGLASLSDDDISPGGAGAQEVRTWVAAACTAGEPLVRVTYRAEPTWITGMGIAATPGLALS